jgi:predicted chitinase
MAEQFPKATIELMKNSLTRYGIANPFLQAGIMAVVSTEGGFYPRSEGSYKNTNNARLRTLFGSRLKDFSENALTNLKQNDEDFYNVIYGGEFGVKNLGNTQPGDGWKYRGRGFNQITGRALYNFIGKQIGVDLINNPEKLNELPVASDALAVFFGSAFKQGKVNGYLQKKFPQLNNEVNKVESAEAGTKLAFQANAGWKTDLSNPVLQKEHEKQLENLKKINEFFLVSSNPIAGAVYQATEIFTNPKKKSYARKF